MPAGWHVQGGQGCSQLMRKPSDQLGVSSIEHPCLRRLKLIPEASLAVVRLRSWLLGSASLTAFMAALISFRERGPDVLCEAHAGRRGPEPNRPIPRNGQGRRKVNPCKKDLQLGPSRVPFFLGRVGSTWTKAKSPRRSHMSWPCKNASGKRRVSHIQGVAETPNQNHTLVKPAQSEVDHLLAPD